jgi:hypothetical protein
VGSGHREQVPVDELAVEGGLRLSQGRLEQALIAQSIGAAIADS